VSDLPREIATALDVLETARRRVELAQRREREATELVDAELARIGWSRLTGAFVPGAAPLYTSRLFPDTTLTLAQTLEHLRQQRAALR
jgi:hypothetical protein